MFPAIVLVQAEIDLHERSPLRSLRFADQMHPGLLRGVVCFDRITLDAGANDILPGSWTSTVPWDDVIKIQILAVENAAAVLAGILVALENIVPGKLDLFLGQMVIDHKEDDPGDPDAKRDGGHRLRVGLLLGQIVPLGETEGLERTVDAIEDSLCMALKEQGQCTAGRANIDRLPEPV